VARQEGYVCDADSLINLFRHYPRPSLKLLRHLARAQVLRIPEGVFRELRRRTDRLSRVLTALERSVVIRIAQNPRVQQELSRLETSYGESIRVGNQTYSGFWKSEAGRKAADGQIVAVAKVLDLTAVSNDQAIQHACSLEGVPCIGWPEFARRLGLTAQVRLRLGGQTQLPGLGDAKNSAEGDTARE
jgi:rRNA-processing protein FCF1